MRLLVTSWLLALAVPLGAETTAEFFEAKVRPLLAAKCYSCHSGKTPMAGIDLSHEAGSKAVAAKLLPAVTHQGPVRMPPAAKLKEAEIAVLTRWVEAGMPWPAAAQGKSGASHWSFQPMRPVPLPEVRPSLINI